MAVYAGAGKSGLFLNGEWKSVLREEIKKAVKERRIRLVVATDAACEGLNLQTLGTLIDVDLPWNPSRLEQRIGRIKRFGQMRDKVDMANLVYHGTIDETVYEKLSSRMQDRYNIFGTLPDVIRDDWIDDIETLDEKLREFTTKKAQAERVRPPLRLRRDRRRKQMGTLRARPGEDRRHEAAVARVGRAVGKGGPGEGSVIELALHSATGDSADHTAAGNLTRAVFVGFELRLGPQGHRRGAICSVYFDGVGFMDFRPPELVDFDRSLDYSREPTIVPNANGM